MIEEMRAELAGLSAKMERVKKIEGMILSLQHEERELAGREQDLRESLAKEEKDVEMLEKTSATSLLYALIGKKTEKLSEEQQEAFAAKLKYDAAVRQMDDCKARLGQLRSERASLSGCAAQYQQAFLKLQEILREEPAYAERLCALERQRGEAAGQLKELNEAISAGDQAIRQIESIEDSLGSAESWGTWDLLGGGLISDLQKHSKLDEAQAGAEQLQVLLSRFHSELADVSVDARIGSVNVDGFLRFADFFFDGLIADLSVLDRIHDSQASVLQVKRQVTGALHKLDELKSARALEKETVEKQLSELVTKA